MLSASVLTLRCAMVGEAHVAAGREGRQTVSSADCTAAQRWARALYLRARDDTRLTHHAVAAGWHDLMHWLGAHVAAVNLFCYGKQSHSTGCDAS
eukprot:gene15448-54018_t